MQPTEQVTPENAYAVFDTLTHRAMCAVLRRLGNGKIGVDPARASKDDLSAKARSEYGPTQVADALRLLTSEEGTAPATADNQPPAPVGGNGSAPFAEQERPVPVPMTERCQDEDCTRYGKAYDIPAEDGRMVCSGTSKASSNGKIDDPAAILATLRKALGGAVDRSQVEEIIDDRFETLRPMLEALAQGQAARVLDVRSNGVPEGIKVDNQHPLFEKVLRLTAAGVNVLLVGPAGCGKSHLCEQVAKALGRSFGSLSLTAGTTESALVGRLLPVGEGGRFGYVESPFARIYGAGGVFLFDELDAADPNMLLVVNSALANGHIEIEQRAAGGLSTRVDRHGETCLLGAANTFGTGANARYVGRGALDAATLDRWYIVEMTYDTAFEASLFAAHPSDAPEITRDVATLGVWVLALRTKVESAGLSRVVSSRMIQKAANARRAGVPVAEIKADLLAGWTPDDLSAVGEGR